MTKELRRIAEEIRTKTWKGTCEQLWGGAGVIVSKNPIEGESALVLVTEHAQEASALIYELRDTCYTWLDYFNKFEFYGRIAEAGIMYTQKANDKWGLLEAMMNEAIELEKQMGSGNLYFAYGSNMNEAQMAKRCPEASLLDVIRIPDYDFALDCKGFATIVEAKGSWVEGLLWRITADDEKSLDGYEGVALGCYRKEFIEVPNVDNNARMLVYISKRPNNTGARSGNYLDGVIDAAKEHGLSKEYIERMKAWNV